MVQHLLSIRLPLHSNDPIPLPVRHQTAGKREHSVRAEAGEGAGEGAGSIQEAPWFKGKLPGGWQQQQQQLCSRCRQ